MVVDYAAFFVVAFTKQLALMSIITSIFISLALEKLT